MNASSQQLASLALKRFGLGARPGDLEIVAPDPRAHILAELDRESAPQPAGCPSLGELYMHKYRWEQHLAETTRRKTGAASAERATAPGMGGEKEVEQEALATLPEGVFRLPEGRFYDAELDARLALLQTPLVGLPERLVWFWSNHFAVAAGKSGWQRITVGHFEREVVRPHIFGKFADMLRASTKHYAMLTYLDNDNSIGPRSAIGAFRGGLNENLAREILELHTLGVDGGYTQRDVESLARILTGWTTGDPRKGAEPGAFVFDANAHEPGPQVLLGRSYRAEGVAQGETALDDLARHTSTARFLAFKLARHFVADQPPKGLVDRLTKVFRDTDGDLRALARALVMDDAAWDAASTKVRTPQEFLSASLRATGVSVSARTANLLLTGMGQRVWFVPGPNGFPDTADAWLSPANFRARFEVAVIIAEREKGSLPPLALARAVLGDRMASETELAVNRAPGRQDAVAAMLLSSEFQRR